MTSPPLEAALSAFNATRAECERAGLEAAFEPGPDTWETLTAAARDQMRSLANVARVCDRIPLADVLTALADLPVGPVQWWLVIDRTVPRLFPDRQP